MYKVKRESLLWPGASQWRIYYHRMWGQLSTTCSNVLKQPNGELLVAVNHNQLRTMASETVDPIDWSHPPPSWAVPPERHLNSINQCKPQRGSNVQPQHARQPPCLCGHSGYKNLFFIPCPVVYSTDIIAPYPRLLHFSFSYYGKYYDTSIQSSSIAVN